MKKILSFILTSAVLTLVVSCSNSKSDKTATDTCCTDTATQYTVKGETACNDGTQIVCGVAFDGAMNSIFLRTEKGDTLSFGYPELEPSKRVSWMIGDTVTIKYIKTPANTDSVIHMYKGCLKDCK